MRGRAVQALASRRMTFALIMAVLSGCNLFSPFESPSGDAQIASAARACLDRNDFRCAADFYGKLSGASSDIAASEMAFLLLDYGGANPEAFGDAFGPDQSNSSGTIITRLAERLSRYNTGSAMRINFLRAYQKTPQIRATQLRGLVRFLTALALVAENLAEDVSTPGILRGTDLATSPSACGLVISSACFGSVSCSGPLGKKLVSGPQISDLDTVAESYFTGPPTFNIINAALTKIQLALNTELTDLGAVGSGASTLTSRFSVADIQTNLPVDNGYALDSPCFRWGLITNGIGE